MTSKTPGMTLKINDVRVGYGADDKLHGVTLNLVRGSFLAVVGPNGSGKSTLLRTMARALRPRLGTVLLDNRPVGNWSPKAFAREVAIVVQQGSPAFDYTAYEVVALGRTPHGGRLTPDKDRNRIVERSMREVGVWEFRERLMGGLSGGERQLVTLARALAQEPDVLLLDEPTNHLDIHHQVAFMEVLLRLNAAGKTILMVVHDLNLAARYAKRIVVLHEGRISAAGTPSVALRPEEIEAAFGAEVELSISPRTGALQIQPVGIPARQTDSPEVHVICGGGSGASLMRRLREEEKPFSAGVVSAGDTDHAVAHSLGAPLVEAESYAPVSEEAHERNVEAAKNARLVVVCDMPIGRGNLRNLEAAMVAQENDVSVVLLRDGLPLWARERDYTGGEATQLLERLVERGASPVESVDEVVGVLDEQVSAAGVEFENR
ncbi:MAG: ABC transporter ATP-binding protein [Rubrobacteraceae bacterium]